MNDEKKADILRLHEEGELSGDAARELLGDAAFDEARATAHDTEAILEEDAGRFLTDEDDEDEFETPPMDEVIEENQEVEDLDIDTSHITEHPPDVDIDDYVEDCNFRIERMGDTHVWVCAYTHDSSEADHHFDISIRGGGLHITHRREDQ